MSAGAGDTFAAMRSTTAAAAVVSMVVVLAACVASGGDGRGAAEQQRPGRGTGTATVTGAAVRRVQVGGYRVVPGGFEVDAVAGWPGRAVDPVLWVGRAPFRDYEFPAATTIRWIVKDRALLVAGSEVAVQYGDDVASRVVVTTALVLP